MSRICPITKKRPLVGYNVSHANNKTKRRQYVNLKYKRIYLSEEKKFIRIRLSARAIRNIDKLGAEAAIAYLEFNG